MLIAAFIVLIYAINVSVVDMDELCEPRTGAVDCEIVGPVANDSLSLFSKNCTTLRGNLVMEKMTALPEKIDVLSNLWFIKGAIVIRNNDFKGSNFSFLNNIRCIENDNGPAVVLEGNSNLFTLGLRKVIYIAGDGEPVFSMIGDSYLQLAPNRELNRLIKAASADGHFHEGLFYVTESNEDYEEIIFFVTFGATCLIVVAFILVGQFVLKIHIPKGRESTRSSISTPSTRSATNSLISSKSKLYSLRIPPASKRGSKKG
ncbi:hypothetical protein RB195_003513 [Necator americanus]|uniref:Receptor L-domain domain-containing protein n=1 Tax=Necator americanus TaxID=51031 RepID=A0ABR1DNY2_NECAM